MSTKPAKQRSHASPTLGIGLAALFALQAAGALLPGMFLWGASAARFAPAPLVAVLALAWLVAWAVGRDRAFTRAAERAGNALARHGAWGALLCMGLAVVVCAYLPDRLLFTGDFVLRQGTVTASADPATMFPQALALDVALHYRLPLGLAAGLGLDANGVGRLIGATDAMLWGLAAWSFARALSLPGAATLAVALSVLFGGALGLFTGYSKAFAELSVLTLASGAALVSASRGGRGLLALAVFTAVAIALHRSGLVLLPAWLVGLVLAARARGRSRALASPDWWAAALLPVATLAACLPGIVRAMRVLDARHLDPPGAGGPLGAALAPSHLLDVANLALALAPLSALIPLLAFARGRARWRTPAGAALLALLVPQLALLLAVHPLQGPFRDWDVFAPAGAALALVALWLTGEALAESGNAGLAAACVLAAAAPVLGALATSHDAGRGETRVAAWLAGPPAVAANAAAAGWDFLALRAMSDARYDAAADDWRRAIGFAPNPRFYSQVGMAESMRGDYAAAQRAFTRAVELNPGLTLGWLGLATASSWLNDVATTQRAYLELRRRAPDHPQLPEIAAYLRKSGATVP